MASVVLPSQEKYKPTKSAAGSMPCARTWHQPGGSSSGVADAASIKTILIVGSTKSERIRELAGADVQLTHEQWYALLTRLEGGPSRARLPSSAIACR